MAKLELTSQERSELRAQAHSLKPVVLIGDAGLSPAVLTEIERALKAHELIKVKAKGEEREAREQILAQICEELDAAPIHHLGKILTVYRPRPVEHKRTSASYERKANDKHIPKKLAAEGKTKAARRTTRIDPTLGNAGLAGKPNRSALGRAFFAAPAQRADISDRQSRGVPKRSANTDEQGQYIPANKQTSKQHGRGAMREQVSYQGRKPSTGRSAGYGDEPVRTTGHIAGKGAGEVLKVEGGYVVAGKFVPSLSHKVPRPGTAPRKPATKRSNELPGDNRRSSSATTRAPSRAPARKTRSR